MPKYPGLFTDLSEYVSIPEETMQSIRGYVEDHQPVGTFLTAVLGNDLLRVCVSCLQQDESNMAVLPLIVKFLFNRCPPACWGTADKVTDWLCGVT